MGRPPNDRVPAQGARRDSNPLGDQLDQDLDLALHRTARIAPVDGGGPCDRCRWRTWRHTNTGMWRHEACEPAGYWQRKTMLQAIAYGRAPQFARPVTSRRVTGCAGCCVCRRRR
jgi:hypothetical protein